MKVIPDLISSVPNEGYSSHVLILSVPNEGYSRNVLYALNKISIYVYYNMLQSLTNLRSLSYNRKC
jgi:hypothetical protein